ncbi:MAG: hypothetical protein RIC16_15980 [Rhodospirillales bacterium]
MRVRRWPAVSGALTCLLLLAACASSPAPDQQADEADTFVADPIADAEPAAEPQVALVPAPPPVPDVNSFLNQNGAEIAGVLGEPGFVRRDPPAELWQYRTGACTLDLFFYDEGGEDYRLAYLDFRDVDSSREARDDCLRAIIQLTEG